MAAPDYTSDQYLTPLGRQMKAQQAAQSPAMMGIPGQSTAPYGGAYQYNLQDLLNAVNSTDLSDQHGFARFKGKNGEALVAQPYYNPSTWEGEGMDRQYKQGSVAGYGVFSDPGDFGGGWLTDGSEAKKMQGRTMDQLDANGQFVKSGPITNWTDGSVMGPWGALAVIAMPFAAAAMGLGAAGAAGAAGAGEAAAAGGFLGDATAAGYAGLDAASASTLGGGASGAWGGGLAAGGTGAMGAGAAGLGGGVETMPSLPLMSTSDTLAEMPQLFSPSASVAGPGLSIPPGIPGGGGGGSGGSGAMGSGAGSGPLPSPVASNALTDSLIPGVSNGQLLGAGASLVGGALGSSAADKAAEQQLASVRESNALLKYIYDDQKAQQAPFRENGLAAGNAMTSALGISGDPNAPGYGSLAKPFQFTQDDPSYQWRLQQGQNALQRAYAGKGKFLSGPAMKGITDYGQNAASQEYGAEFGRDQTQKTNLFNKYASVYGSGQTATNATTNAAGAYGQNASQNITSGGNAAAAGTVGTANAWQNALGGAYNSYQQNELMKRLLPTGA